MMRGLRWLACLGVFALMAGCATPQRIGGTEPAFDRVGRFAVTVKSFDAPVRAAQGGFAWHDTGAVLRLDLLSPMGNVLARVRVEPGHAELVRSNGERQSASNPDALLAQVWGHAVPVAGLRAWIQGRARPGTPESSIVRDAQGHIASIRRDGWDVALSDYDALGPTRVRLSRQDPQASVRLQLVISEG
ncbi:MAG: outer membrane lipoprotein LolB [Alcaligenaceae bacterium]|nr:outer membrane lipoprotein LolB [Alcaligenaceae bacterium]